MHGNGINIQGGLKLLLHMSMKSLPSRQVITMDLAERKAATRIFSVKIVFWGVFLRGSLRCSGQSNLSCKEKSSSVASRGTGKISWSVKKLRTLRYSFVVFASFLEKWWHSFLFLTNWQAAVHSGLVNWGVLLNNWMLWEVCFLNLYLVLTWIPKRINLFCSLMTW